jgi:hypothetical protein
MFMSKTEILYKFSIFILMQINMHYISKSQLCNTNSRYYELSPLVYYCFETGSLLLCCGVYCGIYKSSCNIPNISYLNSPHPPFSFFLSSPLPRITSTAIIFPFTNMCIQFLHHIHLLSPFTISSPPPTGTNPPNPGRTCSSFLFSNDTPKVI